MSNQIDNQAIAKLKGWQIINGKLHKQFVFANFIQAFGFISQVLMVAEKLNHHPELSNVYTKVSFDLITHSSNSITQLDIKLANKIEDIFANS
jgi:4a-hydroxytetrahydrobiopterin dehydratase